MNTYLLNHGLADAVFKMRQILACATQQLCHLRGVGPLHIQCKRRRPLQGD